MPQEFLSDFGIGSATRDKMFFTKAGRAVAILALILGTMQFTLGLGVATGAFIEPTPGATLGTKTSGQAMDKGMYTILFGLIVGILTDIIKSLAHLRKKSGE